jgi:hypothetical protein
VTRAAKPKADPPSLRGWAAIAQFLGLPQSTVQRWAKEGMPVQRAGRNVAANPDELNRWLQRATGEPVGSHVVTPETDLMKDLRASLAAKKLSAKAPSRSRKTSR